MFNVFSMYQILSGRRFAFRVGYYKMVGNPRIKFTLRDNFEIKIDSTINFTLKTDRGKVKFINVKFLFYFLIHFAQYVKTLQESDLPLHLKRIALMLLVLRTDSTQRLICRARITIVSSLKSKYTYLRLNSGEIFIYP